MNTAKQINVMIGLVFVGLIGLFLYFLFDNGFNALGVDFQGREEAATVRQEETKVERGAALFALYCRACHGMTGQGAIERGGLPGAPLNVDANHPPTLTAASAPSTKLRFTDTITCGRVGTQMPPWSIPEGGPLNDYLIEQLVTLITSEFAPDGWEQAVADANEADTLTPPRFLQEAIGEEDTTIAINSVEGLAEEGLLRMGGATIDDPYEILKITSVDEANNTLGVERHVEGSATLAHEAGEAVLNGPSLPPGTITGADGTPPCGQKAAQPAATPGPAVEISGDVTLSLNDNYFDYDGSQNPNFTVAAGDTVSFTLPNDGSNIHNLRLAGPDGEFNTDDDIVSDPDTITSGAEGTLDFTADGAGTIPFRCDFHPTEMTGEITVQ